MASGNLPLKWWQTPKYIAAMAALVFAVGFCIFVWKTVSTADDVSRFGPIVERLDGLSQNNSENIAALERNQVGIDVLVSYVEDLKEREAQSQGEGSTTQMFVNLLCASSDPIRQAACAEVMREEEP